MSDSKYISDFLDAVAADLQGRLPQEDIDSIRATMQPFVPIVLAHALRLSDDRLTALARSSSGWVNYCYTGPTGLLVKLNYPSGFDASRQPESYTVPYSVFFSDLDIAEWRASQDEAYRQRLAAEAAAIKAAQEVEAARIKREADMKVLRDLIAIYGVPQD